MYKKYKTALSIAGSDPSGGAGIQADIKTFSALGCYGMSVITALTAQNTLGVQAVERLPLSFVKQQLYSIFDDVEVDVVKIGMLHRAEIVKAVADKLSERGCRAVVLDPVMVAKSGDPLVDDEAIEVIREQLLPITTIITPNIPEAARLLECREAGCVEEMKEQGFLLLEKGAEAVLMKGGHLPESEDAIDLLVMRDGTAMAFSEPRVLTQNTHGTGCTLSSAIAAYLAHALPLSEAVRDAKTYLTRALHEGADYRLGAGKGPPNHFWNRW